jgi:hypothetical protein
VDEVAERLAIVSEALDAASDALIRARERNVPRSRMPGSLDRLGPIGAVILYAYNRFFVVQREIAADQNDALVAIVNAMREIVRAQSVLRGEIESLRG